jgi:hypothetical protein
MTGADRNYPKLKLAVKPASGPREDSIKHARLMVLDYATVLRHRSDGPIKIFVDRDALDNLESPINPYIHHHDELVARTEPELTRHQAIMDLPPSERANGVRRWSDDVISTLETEAQEHGDMICDLDIDKLCETLKAAKKVRYFVGASFSRLARLIRKGAGGNIECYAQAVRTQSQKFQTGLLIASSGNLRYYTQLNRLSIQHRAES